MSFTREISIKELKNLRIGHAADEKAKTGVTVLYFPHGARVGCDISGGGPASRETPLTSPVTADNPVNAIVLSGGSAYGLAAADGVMHYLESQGIGYPTGNALVPLVCQSCIYDLGYGSADVRPDAALGETACRQAMACTDSRTGNIGAGIGATVGKLYGMKQATKAGLGIAAVELGPLQMAAVVVVNAFGDVFNPKNGRKIAGLKTTDRVGYLDTVEEMYRFMKPHDQFTSNTTIGAVITNATFTKAEMNKIASMTRCAYARCINPVGTMADGDSIYAASTGQVFADINVAGTLATEVMAQAIQNAIQTSKVPDKEFLANCL